MFRVTVLRRTKVLAHWWSICSWCTYITILAWYSIHSRRSLTTRYSITSLTEWREKGEGGSVEGGRWGNQARKQVGVGSRWESKQRREGRSKVEEEKRNIWESHRLSRWATLSRESPTSLRTLKKIDLKVSSVIKIQYYLLLLL